MPGLLSAGAAPPGGRQDDEENAQDFDDHEVGGHRKSLLFALLEWLCHKAIAGDCIIVQS
jgi:hypothetical protein